MAYVTAGRENSAAIRTHYEDHGPGPAITLVHGYALNGHSRKSRKQPCWPPAFSASAHAAAGCVTACLEDPRADLATTSIPVLVIHGDHDRILPHQATSARPPALLNNTHPTVTAGGPHATS